jgi:hypothetical protein
MRSTGEVMGLDRDYALAFAKAQLGAGNELPRSGTVFVSVRDEDKPRVVEAAHPHRQSASRSWPPPAPPIISASRASPSSASTR